MNEIEIIESVLRGNTFLFKEIVDKYETKLFYSALSIVNDKEYARDIVQETFLKAYKNLQTFDKKRNFYVWLYQIMYNLCIDHLRYIKKRQSVSMDNLLEVGATNTSDENSEKKETKKEVYEILDSLPEKYKSVLFLRDIEELPCEEIAFILKTNASTVRWRIHKARLLFKKLWLKRKSKTLSG